jgi:hypothetical protein
MILLGYAALLAFSVFSNEPWSQFSPSPNENGEVQHILSTQATKYCDRLNRELGDPAGHASRS